MSTRHVARFGCIFPAIDSIHFVIRPLSRASSRGGLTHVSSQFDPDAALAFRQQFARELLCFAAAERFDEIEWSAFDGVVSAGVVAFGVGGHDVELVALAASAHGGVAEFLVE